MIGVHLRTRAIDAAFDVLAGLRYARLPTRELATQVVDKLSDLVGEAEPADKPQLGGFTGSSETSRRAALDNYPRAGSQRWRVLRLLRDAGGHGATAAELPMHSADRRLSELKAGGWVEQARYENDALRTRKTPRGSRAAVYVLTDRARRALDAEEARQGG